MTKNAKQELLYIITSRNLTIIKIEITYYNEDEDMCENITVLDDLDFDYNADYGIQELFGIVYCKDSNNHPVWLTRREYDGKEWWEVNTIPDFYNSIK